MNLQLVSIRILRPSLCNRSWCYRYQSYNTFLSRSSIFKSVSADDDQLPLTLDVPGLTPDDRVSPSSPVTSPGWPQVTGQHQTSDDPQRGDITLHRDAKNIKHWKSKYKIYFGNFHINLVDKFSKIFISHTTHCKKLFLFGSTSVRDKNCLMSELGSMAQAEMRVTPTSAFCDL